MRLDRVGTEVRFRIVCSGGQTAMRTRSLVLVRAGRKFAKVISFVRLRQLHFDYYIRPIT
jgi:hypothetical protein